MTWIFQSLSAHPIHLAWLSMLAGAFLWEIFRKPIFRRRCDCP